MSEFETSSTPETKSLPLLPLRDIVVFPNMIVPLFVGRDKSVVALEKAMDSDKEIFLVAQLDPAEDDPARDQLYDLGVVASVRTARRAGCRGCRSRSADALGRRPV